MNKLAIKHLALILFLAGAPSPVLPEDAPKKPLGPRETAAAFLEAALAGRAKEAAAMGQPGQAPSREASIKDAFGEIEVKKLLIVSAYADDEWALVITSKVKVDRTRDREGPLVLTLVRKDNRWLIRDLDAETEESVKDEVKQFLRKHPAARRLPDPAS